MEAFRTCLTVFFLVIIVKKECFAKRRKIWNDFFDDDNAHVFLKIKRGRDFEPNEKDLKYFKSLQNEENREYNGPQNRGKKRQNDWS